MECISHFCSQAKQPNGKTKKSTKVAFLFNRSDKGFLGPMHACGLKISIFTPTHAYGPVPYMTIPSWKFWDVTSWSPGMPRIQIPCLWLGKKWPLYIISACDSWGIFQRGNYVANVVFVRSKMLCYTCNSLYFAVISPYIGTNPSNFARTCCLLPLSLKCRQACRKGRSEDLRKNCSEVEEVYAYYKNN